MAFGGAPLFGSSSTQKSNQQQQNFLDALQASLQSTQRSSVSSTVGQQRSQAATTGLTGTTTAREISRLDPDVINFLKTSLSKAGTDDTRVKALLDQGTVGSAEALNLARFLRDRSFGAEEATRLETGNIIEAERLAGERDIKQATRVAGEAAGGSLNTLVGAQNQRAVEDLAIKLSALASELGITARGIGTNEIAQALAGIQEATGTAVGTAGAISSSAASDTANIALLANILKGATETDTGVSETDFTSLVEQLAESAQTTGLQEFITTLFQNAQQQAGAASGTGKTTGSTSQGLGSSLLSVASSFLPSD